MQHYKKESGNYISQSSGSLHQEPKHSSAPKSIPSSRSTQNLVFVVEHNEVKASRQLFIEKSTYFSNLVQGVNHLQVGPLQSQEIKVFLPNWALYHSFQLFLFCLENGALPDIPDIDEAQNMLWLSDFFRVSEVSQYCIDSLIIPNLSYNNVLTFLRDAFLKLTCEENETMIATHEADDSGKLNTSFADQPKFHTGTKQSLLFQCWFNFLNKCLDLASHKIILLISERPTELEDIETPIFDQIIERAIMTRQQQLLFESRRTVPNQQTFAFLKDEMRQIIHFLAKARNCKENLFSLREHEEERISRQEKGVMLQRFPLLTWKLSLWSQEINLGESNQTQGKVDFSDIFKESDIFEIEGVRWVLQLRGKEGNGWKIVLKRVEPGDLTPQMLSPANSDVVNLFAKEENFQTIPQNPTEGPKPLYPQGSPERQNSSNLETIRVVTEMSENNTKRGIFQFQDSDKKPSLACGPEREDFVVALIGAVKVINQQTEDDNHKTATAFQGNLLSLCLKNEQFSSCELVSCTSLDFPATAIDPETGVVQIQVFIRFKYIYASILQEIASSFHESVRQASYRLDVDDLTTLLSYSNLKVEHEIQVLHFVQMWLMENEASLTDAKFQRIIELVQWSAVPIDQLVDYILALESSSLGKYKQGLECMKRLLRSQISRRSLSIHHSGLQKQCRIYTKNNELQRKLQEERSDFSGTVASLLLEAFQGERRTQRKSSVFSGESQNKRKKKQKTHRVEMPHVVVPSAHPDSSIHSIGTPIQSLPRRFDSIFIQAEHMRHGSLYTPRANGCAHIEFMNKSTASFPKHYGGVIVHEKDHPFSHTIDYESPQKLNDQPSEELEELVQDFDQNAIDVRSPLGTISVKNDEASCGFVSEREYKALGLGRNENSPQPRSKTPSLVNSPNLKLNKNKSEIWQPRIEDEEVEIQDSFQELKGQPVFPPRSSSSLQESMRAINKGHRNPHLMHYPTTNSNESSWTMTSSFIQRLPQKIVQNHLKMKNSKTSESQKSLHARSEDIRPPSRSFVQQERIKTAKKAPSSKQHFKPAGYKTFGRKKV